MREVAGGHRKRLGTGGREGALAPHALERFLALGGGGGVGVLEYGLGGEELLVGLGEGGLFGLVVGEGMGELVSGEEVGGEGLEVVVELGVLEEGVLGA